MKQRWCPMCGHSLSSRQTYCSGACKQRAYRKAKEQRSIQTPGIPRYVRTAGNDGKSAGQGVCDGSDPTTTDVTTVTNRNAAITQTSRERLLWLALRDALLTHAAKGGTPQGTLHVAQQVFLAHGYGCAAGPLPRLPRETLKALGIGKFSPYWYKGKVRTPEEYAQLTGQTNAGEVVLAKLLSHQDNTAKGTQ